MNYVCNGTYQSFVCLDFETTGLSCNHDCVTEIGAVKVIDGELVSKFSTLVNPGRPIPPRVVALTGITNDMVEDHPRIEEILPLFLGFLGNLPLVCHNAKFDCKFLERDLAKTFRTIENPVDDTLRLARIKCPGLPAYKLGYLTDYFQIPLSDAHRAWCDAEATARLYLKLQEI
ncbi:MAG: 3'-5' exonuclease [Oscillospiraceae bacterium]|nr:3'-5' exonuclease [Oscillospiraceae bacterium]